MYCPGCGLENQNELKFCTRCGANLAVVSDALAGRSSGTERDERMVALLKDYYRSRPMTLIGAAGSVLSLFKLASIFALGFPEKMMPIAILLFGFFSLSLYALVWGLIKWNNSSSEMKALGTSPSRLRNAIAAGDRSSPPERYISERDVKVISYSTDPIKGLPSVTEQTTRELDRQTLVRESNKHDRASD